MKRLLIYLGLLATLLAMPYHAKAETWAYYLYGDINGWDKTYAMTEAYKFGEAHSNSASDQPSWTKTFTGKQLDPDRNGVAYFKILLDKDGTTTNLGPSGSNQVLEVNGSAQTLSNSGETVSYMVTGLKPTAEYTIKYVSTTRYGGTISITGPDTENTNIKLKGSYSNDNWATSTAYTSFSDGIYTWEFDKSEFPSGTVFKLFEYVDGTNDHWYSNGAEVTEDWSNEFLSENNNMSVSYTDNDELIKISVQAKKSNGNWKIRIVKTYEPHDYYWVSPQVTNNQKWPYFKLTALRNRSGSFGDGKISDKYFTFTIKNDDLRRYDGTVINDGEKIEWYIARDDDEVWFRPSTDDPTPTESATSLNIGREKDGYSPWDGNIGYRNFNDCKVYDATNTNKFAFNKGTNSTKTGESDYLTNVKSYTFILNSRKSNDNTKGNVYFNYAHNDLPVTTGDCYLLGNFKSATEAEYVCNPGDEKYPENLYGPRKMTQYWYYNGTKYDSQQNPCDSIVYEIKVDKPANGWGNLYLDINPGDNTSWNRVYRPLISLGNTLDGRALIGGLTTAGAGMDNNEGDQSLNPETSNDYTSYTFRFNATTYTYQLEFHTSLYLVGPGVSATEGPGSWDISAPSTSDPRIRLTATQEKDHYRNLVYFTQGQPFRFIKNTDESATPNYKYTWYENDNKPKWVQVTTNEEDYYPGSETQFRNYIQYESDGSESNTEPKDATTNSMTFDLPTGWYYVNFYPNAATPYYTIEHSMELRDFNEVYYRTAGIDEERNVQGRNDYNFLRVWSDHIAWNKPDNIDVFVVSAFDRNTETHVTTATLEKLDVNYIPANTGVILGCKLSKDNLTSGLVYDNAATLAWDNGENVNYYNTLTAELTPYSAPSTSYSGESKLIPLYSAESLKRFSDDTGIGTGDGYANYLFGFYRCKKYQKNYTGNDNDFDMGFWLTTGIGKTYANSAFLHLTKAQAEDLGVGTAYDTAYDTSASRASAPAFMLLFDESDDNVITGISDITTAKGNSVASQGWYTLQGVRTAKPTQRGIYIYNGKKVIVND